MGSLRDQFKKAKLISDKDHRRLAHEERVERKEKGREGIESERAEREAELAKLRDAERQRDKERQAVRDTDRLAAEERAACEAILANEVRAAARGNIPCFFELADGRMPLMRLAELDRHQLHGGQLALVRTKPGDAHVYGLLPIQLAKRVVRQFPERIVWTAPGALAG